MLKGRDKVSVLTSQYLIQDIIDRLLHVKFFAHSSIVSIIIWDTEILYVCKLLLILNHQLLQVIQRLVVLYRFNF